MKKGGDRGSMNGVSMSRNLLPNEDFVNKDSARLQPGLILVHRLFASFRLPVENNPHVLPIKLIPLCLF